MTRIKTIMDTLGWPQGRMGDFLQQAQATVARLASGQPESGPVSILLSQLEAGIASGVISPGMSPEQARAALMPARGPSADGAAA